MPTRAEFPRVAQKPLSDEEIERAYNDAAIVTLRCALRNLKEPERARVVATLRSILDEL